MIDNGEHWDPIKNIKTGSFDESQKRLLEKVDQYKKSPHKILIYLILFSAIPFFVVLYILLTSLYTENTIILIILSFAPSFIYFKIILDLQNESILYLLCKKNNWEYSYAADSARGNVLVEKYPEVFDKGHDRSVQDQVWGNISDKDIDFWRGTFTYTEGYGRYSQTYHKTIFALKLQIKILYPFSLNRPGIFSRGGDMKTESIEFNKLFDIKLYENKQEQEVMRILSPSVQVRLTNFANQYNPDSILLKNNIMFLVFGDDIFQTKYTNFIKKVAVDERDEKAFFKAIKDMAQLPSEMIQFID